MIPIQIGEADIIQPIRVKPLVEAEGLGEYLLIWFAPDQHAKMPCGRVPAVEVAKRYITAVKSKKRVFVLSEEIENLKLKE